MELRRYKDILAIKKDAKFYGFHASNLQLAELDEVAWEAFHHNTPQTAAAREELEFWNQEIDESVTDGHIPQKATSFVINLTQICNLRCTYCAAGGDGTYGDKKGKVDLSVVEPQIVDRLNALQEGDTFHLHFFGGEPLLHPEAIKTLSNFTKLAAAGRNILVHFNITTNGTLITPAIAELLAAIGCHINFSLDGPAELNDHRRPDARGNPSTAKAIAGLKNLLEVRNRLGKINVTGVFGKENLSLVTAYEFYTQFDFDSINFSYQITAEYDGVALKKFLHQYEQVLKIAAAKGEAELRKITSVDHYFSTLDNRQRTVNHCGAGKNVLYSDVRGKLFSCAWLINDKSEVIGEKSHIDAQTLAKYADPLVEKNDCGQCWARYLCGGGCMVANKTKTGDKHKKDFEFCTRMRTQAALSLVQYAELQ